MTNRKFSRKRIGQALGLLVLGLALLGGVAEYGQDARATQGQPEPTTLTFEATTDRNGSLNVQIPMPGNVRLFVRFVVNMSTNPHSLLTNTLVRIEVVGKPGVAKIEKVEHFERIKFSAGEGLLFANMPMSEFRVEGGAAGATISSLQLGLTISPNNPQQKVGLEAVCQVVLVRGNDAQIKPAGSEEWKPVTKETVVRKGDTLKAGDKSSVVLKCGTVIVRVHPNSTTTLTDAILTPPPKVDIKLDIGSVYIDRPSKSKINTNVRTPQAVAAVRGTVFTVGHDPERALSEVAVLVGTVEIVTEPTGRNRLTLTGTGSCEKGALKVTIDKDENISEPQTVPVNPEDWPYCGGG